MFNEDNIYYFIKNYMVSRPISGHRLQAIRKCAETICTILNSGCIVIPFLGVFIFLYFRRKAHDLKAELRTAQEIKRDNTISNIDAKIRHKTFAKINRKLRKVHTGCIVKIPNKTYNKIPYALLVDSMRKSGYTMCVATGREFTENDYMAGCILYISIPWCD